VVTPDSPIVAISFGFRLLLCPFPSITAVPLSKETLISPPLPEESIFASLPANLIVWFGFNR
jgi:hypothetical protein